MGLSRCRDLGPYSETSCYRDMAPCSRRLHFQETCSLQSHHFAKCHHQHFQQSGYLSHKSLKDRSQNHKYHPKDRSQNHKYHLKDRSHIPDRKSACRRSLGTLSCGKRRNSILFIPQGTTDEDCDLFLSDHFHSYQLITHRSHSHSTSFYFKLHLGVVGVVLQRIASDGEVIETLGV